MTYLRHTSGTCASQSSPLTTSYSDYDMYGNVVATVDPDGAALPSLYQSNGCTTGSTIAIANSAWTAGCYTSCTTYDGTHYQALPVSSANAFGQTTSYTYDATQGNLLQNTTDPNNQSTSYSYSYDNSGNRTIQVTQAPDSSHYTTQTSSYTSCPTSSSLPCYEVDTLSYQYNTLFASTFYDSLGRAVETITPGPAPTPAQQGMVYFTVVFTSYNDSNHSSFKSNPFVIAVPSGPSPQRVGYIDPAHATDYNNQTPGGTATYEDALGRTIGVRDALYGTGHDGFTCPTGSSTSYTACILYGIGQGPDNNYYATATSVDPDQHVSASYLDALGRTVYSQQDSGTYGSSPSANEQTTTQYNVLDEPTSVVVKDLAPQSGQTITSVTTTAQYDDLGRLTQVVDPDRGTHTYTYDADGRLTIDSSGSSPARTIGYVYDLLGRLGCVQDTTPASSPTGICTGGNPYVQNSYDSSFIGGSSDYPIGQLTKSIATTYVGSTTATVTEKFAHDPRGQLIQENLVFGLPSAWNVSSALPTYKLALTYNDANQVTTTTTSTSPSGLGYTSTQSYDSTSGVPTGLSNNSSSTPNLATLSYNAQALPTSITYQTSSGGQLAIEQLGYDGDLRVQSLATTWQGGSGNTSGSTILTQGLTYDPASNLINLTTNQAAVPGSNNSGGTETQVFCYNEQNQLVWSGNSGTPSCSGNGSPGTPTGSIAAYSNTFVYTHLGQLWQGPLNGGSTQYQYLYCNSSAPHQLTGLYNIGATCSNQTGQGYASSYDQWGNVTGRTYSGTTGTLSYDILDHLTQWYVSSTNQEQYLYDATGNRVLRRSTPSNGTSIIVYPFGLEEHQYSGSGSNQSNTYYYLLGSRLLGDMDANGTYFLLTDALGSILSEINWSAGGASVQGNQLFGPYGNGRYYVGNFNTAKGFIGQYNDGLTGLDYFNARYYDPVAGVFLSADKVQGNLQGMDPYGYVGGNPETKSDPTGKMMEGQNNEYGHIDSQGNLHIWVQYPSYGNGQDYL